MLSKAAKDEQLSALFDASLDAVIGMDADGDVISWNRQAEVSFGWSVDEALGARLAELIIPPEFRDAHARGLAHYLETGEGPVLNKRIEVEAIDRRGERFPVELAILPLDSSEGRIFYAYLRDIRPRRSLEEDLERRANEARILYEASLAASDSQDFNELVGTCLSEICAMFGWNYGHAYLVNEIAEQIEPTGVWRPAATDFSEEFSSLSFGYGQGLPGRVWKTGLPESIPDLRDPAVVIYRRKEMLEHGFASAFAFPVFVGGRVNAVLEFFSIEPREPDERQIELVRSLGFQLGRVIERHRATARQRLLVRELNHRANNLMAVTMSIFRQTAARAENVPRLAEKFGERLQALSAATHLLSESDWQSAPIRSLLESCLDPFFPDGGFTFEGPDLRLASNHVMTLSLVFHELASNASQRESVNGDPSRLHVCWWLDRLKTGGNALRFRWREEGFRAARTEISAKALVNRLVARESHGELETRKFDRGLEITFAIPLGY